MKFIPYTPPTTMIAGDEFTIMPTERSVLIQRRLEIGLSPKDVAEKTNITLTQYLRFENGTRNITSASVKMFMAICTVLRLDPYTFFPISTLVKNGKEYEDNIDKEEDLLDKMSELVGQNSFDNVSFQE